jgi:hypothetical protein
MIDSTMNAANVRHEMSLAVVNGNGGAIGQVCDLVTSKPSGRILLVISCRTQAGCRLMVVPWKALEKAQGGDLLLDFPQVVIDQLPGVRCAPNAQRVDAQLLRSVRRHYGSLAA